MDVSGINTFNTFNTMQTLLGSMYQVGFGAQTGTATGIGMLPNLLSIGQNSQFLTDSLANQRSLNMSALNLRNAASPLIAGGLNSVFSQSAATSSNANAVTATPLANAAPGIYQAGVSQLAQGQTVAGEPAGAFAPTGVTTSNGYGQMEFYINGNVRDVTYQLNGSETNQEAFGALAAAINERGIGITAGVTVNQAGGASLNLTGPAGAANSFTVTDIMGNAAAFTGIASPANVTQTAQNSAFTVNGANFTDATNQPTLAVTGLQLNLLQTTGTNPVDITVGSNSTDVTAAIKDFVSAFNTTLSALSAGTSITGQSSAAGLSMLARAYSSNLQSIGITAGAGGSLTVNDTQLQNSLATQPGAVKTAFNGPGSFATGVQTMADNIINQSLSSTGNINYANFYSSYFQSAYNANSLFASNMGLFLNSFM